MELVPVYMPKFGMTMEAGTIIEWLADEGDTVKEGDALVVIETEKVETELEAPASGVIAEISYTADAEVPVGEIYRLHRKRIAGLMGRLAGKTAIVTGAARGIGKAIALRFRG